MLLKEIDKMVINLPSRPDRLEELKKELKGWDYQIVNGVIHNTPMLGVAQAHLNCVTIAKQRDLPCALIMEDDVVLRPGAEEYFNQALEHAPADWDILLGGLYLSKNYKSVNDYWASTGEFCGLHFYLANSKAYDKILTYEGRSHIDRWMNLKGERLKTYVTKKFVATQREGFSDNVQKRVNYCDQIKRFQLL